MNVVFTKNSLNYTGILFSGLITAIAISTCFGEDQGAIPEIPPLAPPPSIIDSSTNKDVVKTPTPDVSAPLPPQPTPTPPIIPTEKPKLEKKGDGSASFTVDMIKSPKTPVNQSANIKKAEDLISGGHKDLQKPPTTKASNTPATPTNQPIKEAAPKKVVASEKKPPVIGVKVESSSNKNQAVKVNGHPAPAIDPVQANLRHTAEEAAIKEATDLKLAEDKIIKQKSAEITHKDVMREEKPQTTPAKTIDKPKPVNTVKASAVAKINEKKQSPVGPVEIKEIPKPEVAQEVHRLEEIKKEEAVKAEAALALKNQRLNVISASSTTNQKGNSKLLNPGDRLTVKITGLNGGGGFTKVVTVSPASTISIAVHPNEPPMHVNEMTIQNLQDALTSVLKLAGQHQVVVIIEK